MKKKIYICLLLILPCCFILLFSGLKVNASNISVSGVKIDLPDTLDAFIYFQLPSAPNDVTLNERNTFIYDNTNRRAIMVIEPVSVSTGNVTGFKTYTYNCYFIDSSGNINFNNVYVLDTGILYAIHYDCQNIQFWFYELSITWNENSVITANNVSNNYITFCTISNVESRTSQISINSLGFIASRLVVSPASDYSLRNYAANIINGDALFYASLTRFSSGYQAGYQAGYNQGQTGDTAMTPVFNVLTHVFTSLGSILSIELVPHIPLGLFLLVPLFFAVLGLILWIWRRN